MRVIKKGLLTTVQYLCDRYKMVNNDRINSAYWIDPVIPAWDFIIFVRAGIGFYFIKV